MPSQSSWMYTALLALPLYVSAHGFVEKIKIGDIEYPAFSPRSDINVKNAPNHVGWAINNANTAFIDYTDGWSSESVICHNDAKPAPGHATVAAGDQVKAYWTNGDHGWPADHAGPLLQYLAPCPNDDCSTADKFKLKFSKISADGLLHGGDDLLHQSWATDWVHGNDSWQTTVIPKDIKPGKYVLRTEIVNGQFAYTKGDAQLWPNCVNLDITGDGTTDLTTQGTLGQELYKPDDFTYDPTRPMDHYDLPGPPTYTPNAGGAAEGNHDATPTAAAGTPSATAAPVETSGPAPQPAPEPVETPEPVEEPEPVETPEPTEISQPVETAQPVQPPSPTKTPCTYRPRPTSWDFWRGQWHGNGRWHHQ